MPVSPLIPSDPTELLNSACEFDCKIPPGKQAVVQTYELAIIANNLAGTSLDPQVLLDASCEFQCKIPAGLLPYVQAYLLQQIVNAL